MLDSDVIVCGGGPAGLAAAIACSMRGLAVSVLEWRRPPVDKPCGEGLLPEAISALDQLGIPPQDLPGVPFQGIRFVDGPGSPVQASFRNGWGRGVRRVELHAVLHRRAQQSGVDLRWGTQVRGMRQSTDAVELITACGTLRARWCIGADGLASQVRRWAGLDRGSRPTQRIGLRQHYAVQPWSRFMEVHWGRMGQVYVTPTADSGLCIAAVGRKRYRSVPEALSEIPELYERLRGAESTSAECGALTCNRALTCVTAGRVALAGDASGSVDAITGAGLALAFQHALAVSYAIEIGNLAKYERAHKQIRLRATLLGLLLLQLDRFPLLRKAALSSFRRNPQLFEQMLAIHTGAAPLSLLGSSGALTLGVQLLLG